MVRVTMTRFAAKPKCRCCVRPCRHEQARAIDMSDLLGSRPVVLDRDLLERRRREIIRDTGSRPDPTTNGVREAREAKGL